MGKNLNWELRKDKARPKIAKRKLLATVTVEIERKMEDVFAREGRGEGAGHGGIGMENSKVSREH